MNQYGCFDFSFALEMLKEGKRVARKGWKNVACIYLVEGSEFQVNRPPLLGIYTEGTDVSYAGHIDAVFVPDEANTTKVHTGVWTASNGDLLADDWYEVTEY